MSRSPRYLSIVFEMNVANALSGEKRSTLSFQARFHAAHLDCERFPLFHGVTTFRRAKFGKVYYVCLTQSRLLSLAASLYASRAARCLPRRKLKREHIRDKILIY